MGCINHQKMGGANDIAIPTLEKRRKRSSVRIDGTMWAIPMLMTNITRCVEIVKVGDSVRMGEGLLVVTHHLPSSKTSFFLNAHWISLEIPLLGLDWWLGFSLPTMCRSFSQLETMCFFFKHLSNRLHPPALEYQDSLFC